MTAIVLILLFIIVVNIVKRTNVKSHKSKIDNDKNLLDLTDSRLQYKFPINGIEAAQYSSGLKVGSKVKVWSNPNDRPQVRLYLSGYYSGEGMLSIKRLEKVYDFIHPNVDGIKIESKVIKSGLTSVVVEINKVAVKTKAEQESHCLESALKKFNSKRKLSKMSTSFDFSSKKLIRPNLDNPHLDVQVAVDDYEEQVKRYINAWCLSEDPLKVLSQMFVVKLKDEVISSKIDHLRSLNETVRMMRMFKDFQLESCELVYRGGSFKENGEWDNRRPTRNADNAFRYRLNLKFQ
jgi:hypothetical protein